MINTRVHEILSEFKIRREDGILYLLTLHYGYKTPSYIPQSLKVKIEASGLVSITPKGEVTWNIPLFEDQATEFDWVKTEFLNVFRPFGKHTKFKRECVARMKRIFALHPHVRKQDVLGGTRMYIRECQMKGLSEKYVKSPHYFILEGRGAQQGSQLLTWVEEFQSQETKARQHKSNILQ